MVIILVKEITPRIEYTMNLVFNEVMGIPYSVTSNQNDFQQSPGQKINYTKNQIPGCLRIKPSDLLNESELVNHQIETGNWKRLPTLFANDGEDVPFDIFSAIFYLVSRYEEYLPFVSDPYGRFEANQSIAFKYKFLHMPVIDLWCQQLAEELNIFKYCKSLKAENYNFTLTIDIDHAWMFRHRGIARNTAKLIRELLFFNFREFKFKFRILQNKTNDPGDSYQYLEKLREKLAQPIRYFILSGGNHKFDTNLPIQNKAFRNLIQKLGKQNPVGLHPSIHSNSSFEQLSREHDDLSAITGQPIRSSRQHYLMLSLPHTYRNLIKLGISDDYTMGYGSQTGFRAGIARSFYYYDLLEEKQTSLRIFPFQVMDRTLISYLNYTPEYAIREFNHYKDVVSSVGGHFIAIWHNTSLNDTYEWKGWRKVFEEMITMNQ